MNINRLDSFLKTFFETQYQRQDKSESISLVTFETFIASPSSEPLNKTILSYFIFLLTSLGIYGHGCCYLYCF